MAIIWKIPVKAGKNEIELPRGSKLLYLGLDGDDKPHGWFQVESTNNPAVIITIEGYFTGIAFESSAKRYIGSIKNVGIVLHFYQLGRTRLK